MKNKAFVIAAALGLTALASASIPNYGTFNGDGFLFGFNNNNTQGYITCEWYGYASPYTPAVPGFRLVIWSASNMYLAPIYSEQFGAYSYSSHYYRNVSVPWGYPTEVDVYATGNQYSNSPSLNWCYVSSWWIHNQ